MREMIYSTDSKREILSTGYCFGLLYFILNLGLHPTAYIKLPNNSKIDENDIDVHGGVTYSDDHLWINDNEKLDGKFIGWDYAHYGDYGGYCYVGFRHSLCHGWSSGPVSFLLEEDKE